ncbi:BspA family leucine-rich repeat surface protein [Lactococcus petauri]|uniref:BspA family leucine-rich repeat surface protein n=1 Tax=Lactococcus petauri TaxID=1940789 RepID=UPI003854FA0C
MKERFKSRFRERKGQIRLLGFLTLLVVSVSFLGLAIPKIMAGDTQVSDLILQGESKEQSITLTLKDEHPEDTKIVIPLPEGVTYTSNSNSNIGITYDELNKQLVIDWVEGAEKQVELQLEAEQEGHYDFTARTVRDGEPVTSLPWSVIIREAASSEAITGQNTEPPKENQTEVVENTSTEETDEEGVINSKAEVLSGVWGTAPWEYDEESGTMTIHEGELSESADNSAWSQMESGWGNIKKVVFEGKVVAPTNCKWLFMRRQGQTGGYNALSKLEEIDFGMLDTSNVTSMSSMFYGVRLVPTLDLSSFDTSSVKDMSSMFSGVSALTSIDLSSFDTSSVKDMSSMFSGASSLTALDLSSFDTRSVTSMSSMFNGASSLTALDLSSFDTSKVTRMSSMFNGASSLTALDLSSFDTRSVTSMSSMFDGASSLPSIDLSSFDTRSVTSMSFMFNGASSLTALDLSSFDTSSVKDMSSMFNEASSLTALDLSSFDTRSVTSMSSMFNGASSLPSIDLSSFDTRSVTTMTSMFNGASALQILDLSSFDTRSVMSMASMFNGASALQILDLSSFDTRSVTTMFSMFNGASALQILDLSSFDTHSVTDMQYMFNGASSLTSIDLSSFDTRSVTSMFSMFNGASSLTSIDLSSFDTRSVIEMGSMFRGVSSLTTLDVSSFDTSSVKGMASMFSDASSLTMLDLSSFDTRKVLYVSSMFKGASSLTMLDLSSFDMNAIMTRQDMLAGTSSLKEFKLGKDVKFSGIERLPDRNATSTTTGKWQNIGSGTKDEPEGEYIFTSEELLANYNGEVMADTYVLQPMVTPLLTQAIESQNQEKDGNNYAGDILDFSVKISNSVSSINAFVTSGSIQISIPKSFELNKESIEVKTAKGEKLEDILIDLNNEKEIKISGKGLNILTTEDVIVNYSITTTQSGNHTTQSIVRYSNAVGQGQAAVTTAHEVSIKQMPIDTTLLPEDSSKYSDDDEEFPDHTTLVKSDKTPLIFTLKNEDNVRNRTLSNFDIWFDLSNFDETLEVDKDTFYIKENKSSDWEKIDASQIDSNGSKGDKQYSITGLNASLLRNDEIQIKFSIMAKTNFSPQKAAITAQGTVQNSGVFSGTNTLSAKTGELRFEKVPEFMDFETSKISNRTKEIKRKDEGWNLIVEDTRLEKKNWRVAVELSEPFKDIYGNEAKGDLLFFRNSLGEKQWINNTGMTVFDGTSGEEEDYYKVSWEKDKGLLLEVAPGVVKVGNYQSTLNWTLVDAPA